MLDFRWYFLFSVLGFNFAGLGTAVFVLFDSLWFLVGDQRCCLLFLLLFAGGNVLFWKLFNYHRCFWAFIPSISGFVICFLMRLSLIFTDLKWTVFMFSAVLLYLLWSVTIYAACCCCSSMSCLNFCSGSYSVESSCLPWNLSYQKLLFGDQFILHIC